jgi:hypothetical protein
LGCRGFLGRGGHSSEIIESVKHFIKLFRLTDLTY